MKKPLIAVLVLSLAFNIAFALLQLFKPAAPAAGSPDAAAGTSLAGGASTAAGPAGSSTAAGGGGGAASGARPSARSAITWTSAGAGGDLRALVSNLRAAGFPAPVIRAVVNQMLTDRFADRQPDAGLPFWKRSNLSPEMVAAQLALSNERRELFETLLGDDARPSAMIDDAARERRYGNISDDKLDAIAKIERDYNEINAEAWAKRRGNLAVTNENLRETQRMMESEKLADLAAVLSPTELTQYEMRNSQSARMLMNNLRNVDVSEAEYATLYEAQKAFDTANPMLGTMDQVTYAQRQTAQMAMNEQVRGTLGEARFYSYLEGADHNYANVARTLAKYPSVSPAATYQVYQLQTELQTTLSQATRGGRLPPEKVEELRTLADTYNTRLESLVGPEAANAYRNQGMGRVFSSFRQAPRPANPGGG